MPPTAHARRATGHCGALPSLCSQRRRTPEVHCRLAGLPRLQLGPRVQSRVGGDLTCRDRTTDCDNLRFCARRPPATSFLPQLTERQKSASRAVLGTKTRRSGQVARDIRTTSAPSGPAETASGARLEYCWLCAYFCRLNATPNVRARVSFRPDGGVSPHRRPRWCGDIGTSELRVTSSTAGMPVAPGLWVASHASAQR